MEPQPEPEPRKVFVGRGEKRGAWDHEKGRRRDEDEGGRPRREPRPRRGRSDVTYATYRIAVGKRHRVEPRQIVGAIANEGGLGRDDFGHIDIRGDHSLVELPADLPPETFAALAGTRISGKLIELAPDGGGSARRASYDRKRPEGKRPHRKGGSADRTDDAGARKKPRAKKPKD